MMPGDDVLTEPMARRIEVFTEDGRRRRWNREDKARIVAESYSTSVGEVADRYLTEVITRIVQGHPQSRLDELLPWESRPS